MTETAKGRLDLEALETEASILLRQVGRESHIRDLLVWARDHHDDPSSESVRGFVLARLPYGVEHIGELDRLIEAGTGLFAEYVETLTELDGSRQTPLAA